MLHSKLATFTAALILAGSVFAGQKNICPDINDIKAEGLSMAEKMGDTVYIAFNISNYNTDAEWGFVVAPLQANSEEEAIITGNQILSTLSAAGIPEEHGNTVICDYKTDIENFAAVAIKDDGRVIPSKLKYLLKKHTN